MKDKIKINYEVVKNFDHLVFFKSRLPESYNIY